MVQDFNEFIDALNRRAYGSSVSRQIPFQGYTRLEGNPASMFYPKQLTPQEAVGKIQDAVGDTSKAVAKTGAKKGAMKAVLQNAPLVGDVYDIGRGLYQAFNGHPYIGLGQAGLGAFGLSTLGAGSLVKSGGKALVKSALKKGVSKDAIRNIQKLANASKLTKSAKYQIGSAVLPELAYKMSGDNKPIENIDNQSETIANTQSQSQPTFEEIDIPEGSYVSYDDILSKGGVGQLPTSLDSNPQVDYEVLKQVVDGGDGNYNPQDILARYQQQLIEKNRPYIEGLEAYYKDYNKNLKDTRDWQRYYTGLAGWTGNKRWADVAKYYNPLEAEAQRLNMLQQLQNIKSGNIDELNKLQGNVAIANSLGLPSEAALANKDLLNAYVNQQRAQLNYNARVYDTNIDNATRVAIKQGDWDTAFKLQNMKNQGNLRNAFASSGAFYSNPQQMANVMKMLGVEPRYIPVANGLDEQGLPAVQPAINYYAGESK